MFGELWDSFKRAIVPKSHAEAVVDEIYGEENQGMLGTPGYKSQPYYDPDLAKVPAKIVTTIEVIGGATERAGDAIFGNLRNLAIWLFAALIVLAAVYGFFGRRES
jgi:hypothetical protein